MKWTEEETELLLRTRQAHPDASWRIVAYHYNAEVPEDRERSHWSLTWKYRDLLSSDPHPSPDGQYQTEGNASAYNDPSAQFEFPTTHHHHLPRKSTTLRPAYSVNDLNTAHHHRLPLNSTTLRSAVSVNDLNTATGSRPTLRIPQQKTQKLRQRESSTEKIPDTTPEPLIPGFNSARSVISLPTSFTSSFQLQPQSRYSYPHVGSVSFAAPHNNPSYTRNLTIANDSSEPSRAIPQTAHQFAYTHYTPPLYEYGSAWREIPNAPGYLEGPWQDVNARGPFMGYPPSFERFGGRSWD
ncbi:MAG: hypothetical protein Q9164_005976 [Protoblastenia rupestris]